MKPTDEQLNQAAAKACGWQPAVRGDRWVRPDGLLSSYIPDYCTDRNALPELWNRLKETGRIPQLNFTVALDTMFTLPRPHHEWEIWEWTWFIATAEPRLHVIAALHALDKWQEEWES